MQFAILGSGSRGNATLIQSDQTCLMVDCGFSIRETCRRLEMLDTGPETIDGILVTHEHSDHIRGVGPFAKRYSIPVWASNGTAMLLQDKDVEVNRINVHETFEIDEMKVYPVPVPHDAREPCQFVIEAKGKRLGILTDVGSVTSHITQTYKDCDALMLEFNHDIDMLENSSYPFNVKKRIAGNLGHLNNEQSCALLQELLPGQLRHIVAAHLSESNNRASHVRELMETRINGVDCAFDVASQDNVSGWYSMDQSC
ncbi:MAG: MBL fold metallo-hydrolase [Gammaproteobacteria bacterium]|nr:MAG: MBL fold metallo-hydrolase [Gammaproteobacteria bacterium]